MALALLTTLSVHLGRFRRCPLVPILLLRGFIPIAGDGDRQWFSNVGPSEPLEDVVKCCWATCRVSDSGDLGGSWRVCISNQFPGDAVGLEPPLGEHLPSVSVLGALGFPPGGAEEAPSRFQGPGGLCFRVLISPSWS